MLTEFGRYMRDFRIRRNLLLKNMADDLGYASAYASGIEHGKYMIPPGYFRKLQEVYDMTPTEYFHARQAAQFPTKSMSISFEGKSAQRQELLAKLIEVLPKFSDAELETIVAKYWQEPEQITLEMVAKNMKEGPA